MQFKKNAYNFTSWFTFAFDKICNMYLRTVNFCVHGKFNKSNPNIYLHITFASHFPPPAVHCVCVCFFYVSFHACASSVSCKCRERAPIGFVCFGSLASLAFK